MSPRRKVGPPARNLVFTSAGDWSNISGWLTGRRNFDLWISYYGDEPGRDADVADFYNVRRDAKFGNLKFVYDTWPRLPAPYEAVLVRRVATVDAITCVNPMDRTKGGSRECDRIESESESALVWDIVRAKYGVDRHPHREFGRISKQQRACGLRATK